MLTGPTGAILVGVAAIAFASGMPLVVRTFNAAKQVLQVALASVAFTALGGEWTGPSHGHDSIPRDLGLPMLGVIVTMFLFSAVAVAGIVHIDTRTPFGEVFAGIVRSLSVPYVGYGVLALLLVVLWDDAGVGPLSAALVLAPLFVARWAFAQYAAQHAAHERTVAALVTAVEAKDHYTRGHSDRVARASVLIGRTLGLSQQRTSTLHFAGMLHDIGKIGVPTPVLQKTGPLTDAEFETIARHPVRGLEMVREIEFLGEALQAILHHHERLDGRGYPMGMHGMEIPEFARIIAVADAFDAMTSTRSYRGARSVEAALTEPRACTGTQFDPRFVLALEQALERSPWEPEVEGDGTAPRFETAPASRASVVQHDAPRPTPADDVDVDDVDDADEADEADDAGRRPDAGPHPVPTQGGST
ncbi:metal-dependent phosphohydrolase [Angustibacter aerolatus]|uniref:Metal-dependent phosphohydrolase n=1 Tax=Angustibacter aerolatus TaxID=1162965 RepID=A0ABQ6JMK2_9ACTN|nr:HD-GYP domain-containing protein [Angustibacter aerolatus]GMA88554.1 metal-dependent phosphohydrolase [Angustibacter aerolatus]